MNKELEMNPNQLVAFIGKPCAEFTKSRYHTLYPRERYPYG